MFLEQLSKTSWASEFRFICVDPQPGKPRPALPPWLKVVPTLMIAGEAEPRRDANVMNWLSERRMREGGKPAIAVASATAKAGAAGGKPRSIRDGGGPMGISSPLGVSSSEGLDAIIDSLNQSGDEGFCYIGEDTSAGQGAMVRLAANQVSLNMLEGMPNGSPGAKQPTGYSAAGGSGMGGSGASAMSAKAKLLDDRMSAFQAQRQLDMGPGRR